LSQDESAVTIHDVARPIEVSVLIDAPLARVWAELADFGSHPQWMDDAATVRFLTDRTTGIGTRIEAATRVGPLRASDVMEVVRWEVERTIVVEHVGSVKGFGRFDIVPIGDGTEMRWVEDLRFPWWMGGPVGLAVAGPILQRIWRGSLMRLKGRLEISDL
jgi:uncharacterized protein YndB with AHSA1/START domain